MRINNLPLEIAKTKRTKYYLDFNRFTRYHHKTKNTVRARYQELVKKLITDKSIFTKPVKLTFTFYSKDKRKKDLSNMCSIVDKVTTDVLVQLNILQDDTYTHIPQVNYIYGGIADFNKIDLLIEEI